jgi:hypothetical protein
MNTNAVVLGVRGLHIPSFKNHKHSNRSGFVYLDKRVKALMDKITHSLLWQLRSMFRTTGSATRTGCSAQSLTALYEHCDRFDDAWQWIPRITVTVEMVPKGQEGVRIEIERMTQ